MIGLEFREAATTMKQRSVPITTVAPSSSNPPVIAPDDPSGVAVQAAIAWSMQRFDAVEPEARTGAVEGVHRMRTTTRRLRSDLRTFRPLIDHDWAAALETELKWLGAALGAVRDLDVLTDYLHQSAVECAASEALGPLFQSLDARRAAAREALHSVLSSPRFERLGDQLRTAAERPALRDEARTSCASVLPGLVAATWRRLKQAARALKPSDPDEAFHQVRKRAKRARYAAEAVARALGRDSTKALRFARRVQAVQDVLGSHQDAVIARDEVRAFRALGAHDGACQRAADSLIDDQERAADDSRDRFHASWHQLDRPKNVRWLKKR